MRLFPHLEDFPELPSTQVEAKTRLLAHDPVGAIFARQQTAGYGRYGRAWSSPPDTSLSLTLTFNEPLEPSPWLIGMAVAVCAAETVGGSLRWPNDLVYPVGQQVLKLGGILSEVVEGHLLVGVGLNLRQTEFPPELAGIATSVLLATGRALAPHDTARALWDAVCACERPHTFADLRPRWMARDLTPGKLFRTPDGRSYTASTIGPRGELIATDGTAITVAETTLPDHQRSS